MVMWWWNTAGGKKGTIVEAQPWMWVGGNCPLYLVLCAAIFELAKPLGMMGKDIAEAPKYSGIEFDPLNWDLMTRIVVAHVNGGEVIST